MLRRIVFTSFVLLLTLVAAGIVPLTGALLTFKLRGTAIHAGAESAVILTLAMGGLLGLAASRAWRSRVGRQPRRVGAGESRTPTTLAPAHAR